jgi:hypothetical protein
VHFGEAQRDGVMRGKITESVRVWLRPKVREGGRYAMGAGHIEVTAITEIAPERINDALARRTGFADAASLMKIARHGPGDRIYLVRFVYHKGAPPPPDKPRKTPRRKIRL